MRIPTINFPPEVINTFASISWDQIGIACTGAIAVYLTQQKREHWKRYACLFGMAGQPFWFYCAWKSGQVGVFIVSFMYTYSWWIGIRNHWLPWIPEWWRNGLPTWYRDWRRGYSDADIKSANKKWDTAPQFAGQIVYVTEREFRAICGEAQTYQLGPMRFQKI
jgi:hypothetical protein